jgi:hypothetical protein
VNRRLKQLEHRRERQVHSLGRLALDMHRRDQVDSTLLMKRAKELAETEKELGQVHIAIEQGWDPAQSDSAGQ